MAKTDANMTEAEMLKALDEGQFKVYYQPKYDLRTEMVAGAEALVRWEHPEKGLLPPGDFIGAFEKAGLITRLDQFVWEKVCQDIMHWKKSGYPHAAISVNVSREDLYQDNLPEIFDELTKKYEISVQFLHLEITESVYVEDSDQMIKVVGELHDRGFIIEMDNFGKAYSSLKVLAEMPVDVLKLDMKFIQQETEKTTGKGLLNFVISLAKWMQLSVVAEGVERPEQVSLLRSMDCNYVQGFYYDRPMPAETFEKLLKTSAVAGIFQDDSGQSQQGAAINISENTENRREMLIVDDMEINRTSLSETFCNNYFTVEVENGRQAWNYLEQHYQTIDIVMLDLIMPVMDGFELLKLIRSDDRTKNIPVIVTSQGDSESERKALEMRANDFISKPYNPEVVRQRVRNVMDSQKMQRILQNIKTTVPADTEKLLEAQIRYRYILDNLDVAYFETDEQGGYYASDKYSLYAMSDEPIEDIREKKGNFATVYPADIPKLFEFFNMKNQNLPKISVTLRLKMKDGTFRWTELMSFYEFDEQGKRVKTIVILRDVDKEWMHQNSQLQDALDVAEKANRAKTDFLARVSHDMRTPLNGILGLTSLMEGKAIDPEIRNDLEQLNQSGRYLLNLIDDTLDVSQIESGRMELHPVVCDGKAAFESVITMVKPLMDKKHIQFKMTVGELPFTKLYIDIGRVEQAVMNVLTNAVKFTPEGGTIEFSMENESTTDEVITDKIVIKDNGIGMSQKFLKTLFEPFSQEHNDTKSIHRGTGLGMTISKQCMELMGGSIDVVSKKGVGTTVTLILPMKVATKEQIAEWNTTNEHMDDANILAGKHILLCEDHPLNAVISTKLLERRGMIVDHAVNGKEGLNKFMSSMIGYYDAVLMDIRMPVMDGLEASRAIRNLMRSDAQNVPIIAMTANALNQDVKNAINAGMTEHLGKPVEPVKLYRTLTELILTPKPHAGKKILVVDDIEMNRAFVRKAIAGNYQVLEAGNGVEALRVLQEEKDIIAVITDVQMPAMDGKELIKRIRSNPELDHVAILANTIYGDHRQEDELIGLGANDFVYKPSSPKIVMLRLEHILRHI